MKHSIENHLGVEFAGFRPEFERFEAEYKEFAQSSRQSTRGLELAWRNRLPRLDDKTPTRDFEAHYTYHPAWAARIIAKIRPALHIDVSSSLAFCTMVSAFVPVEFYDIRPAELALTGLTCKSGDLTHLPIDSQSVTSLSCMHVVEHIGLGRYGDPLDPEGDLKGISELIRVLAKGGSLLFVAPVGRPKLCFNAHRIYSCEQVRSYFADLRIEQFALVDDHYEFTLGADPDYASQQEWGCGCWWFRK